MDHTEGRHVVGGDGQPVVTVERASLHAQEKNKRVLKLKSNLKAMEEEETRKRMQIIENMALEYEALLATYQRGASVYVEQITKLQEKLAKSTKGESKSRSQLSALQERYDALGISHATHVSNVTILSSQVSLLARQKASAEGDLKEEMRKCLELVMQLSKEKTMAADSVEKLEKELKKEKAKRRKAEEKLAESASMMVSIKEDTVSASVKIKKISDATTVDVVPKKADLEIKTEDSTTVQTLNGPNYKRKYDDFSQVQEAQVISLPIYSIGAKKMPRTKQTARKSTGGHAPRKQLPVTRITAKDGAKAEGSEEGEGSKPDVFEKPTTLRMRMKSRGDLPAERSNSGVTFGQGQLSALEMFCKGKRNLQKQRPETKKRKLDASGQDVTKTLKQF
ncbi:hypothetical protein CPB83DRAFT_902499 [Crepidotus variabilis]|uniref:Uncharacterized protein n=1 Tax=Crepidotus variabilis TaxID=179855 RepID=A0A9P6ERM2_9AGAR|nr:hypothetical protein CPB83DRAFT_902499 [Crepidotus variabilis]